MSSSEGTRTSNSFPTEQRQLTPEELQWVANMRRLLGIERIEQYLMNPQGQGQPMQNGHAQPQQQGGFWQLVDHVVEAAGKIIDKIPPQAFGGGESSLERQFSARYLNLMDTAYGRYIPPLVPPNVAVPPVQHVVTP